MMKIHENPRLAAHALARVGVVGHLFFHDFDSDVRTSRNVSRSIDIALPSFTEFFRQLVVTAEDLTNARRFCHEETVQYHEILVASQHLVRRPVCKAPSCDTLRPMTYQQLHNHFSRIGHLEEIAAIVEWDQAVNMPPAAGPERAKATAGLARISHEMLADPSVTEWLTEIDESELDPFQCANVSEIRRLHRRALAVPADLIEATAQATKVSEHAWRQYRAENDFSSFAPYLKNVIAAKREVGAALADALEMDPYDALMDEFEPGMRAADVDPVFASLREFLPRFVQEVMERQQGQNFIPFDGHFPIAEQKALGLSLMKATGLAMDRARLDVSHHPFCGGVPKDVRITTRYDESEFLSSLMAVLHEAGHAKYEQGLPDQWAHQPVGRARGMVCHESQSLLQEMQVCRGPEFLQFLTSHLLDAFSEQASTQPAAFTPENLSALVTRVQPGLIRVDADEVTYPAHIMMRYDIEKDLIAGKLDVSDLPEAWDEGMQRYLGLSTKGNDRDGCLQDIHWTVGAFGYFPLYTLGAMVAAQLFEAARHKLHDLPSQIRSGDFTALNEFLEKHVWSQGSRMNVEEILIATTGEPLSSSYFVDHLRRRYLGT